MPFFQLTFYALTVLKAQQGMAAGVAVANSTDTTSEASSANTEQISQQLAYVQQQLAEMTHARDYYYYEMVKKDQELTAVVSIVVWQ